jgi:elongation factor Ts
MAITADQIKKLRELTGAGVLDAKRTLEKHSGNFDDAVAELRAKGLAAAAKKTERTARQGLIETYVHGEGRVGAMLELNCETDFVARTPDFRELAHEIALQIVAANPKYVSPEDIPASIREEQGKIFAEGARAEGKSAGLIDKIVQGKMENFYKETCLIRQPFIRDESVTVHDLIQSKIAKLGENIVVRRFARFELGE